MTEEIRNIKTSVYLWILKKIAPIFLFLIICINHLNIIDAVMHFSAKHKKENNEVIKTFPLDEQSDAEKENKGKEKIEESEKYLNSYHTLNQYKLAEKDKFICFATMLNKHPYKDDDIQPPKAV
jgi:hypothetical protein